MENLFGDQKTGVIVACDVRSDNELKELVRQTAGVEGIVGYKVGCMLGLRYGLGTVMDTIDEYASNAVVIYDHQKAGTDVPHLGKGFAEVVGEANINAAIIFPQSGPETEVAFINALKGEGVVPIGGGEMTHPKYLVKDGGFISDDAPVRMYEIELENGVEYFIVPGNKPKSIKRFIDGPFRNKKVTFASPGHGKQGGFLPSAINASYPYPYFGIIGTTIYAQPVGEGKKYPNFESPRKAAEFYADEALTTWKDLEEKLVKN